MAVYGDRGIDDIFKSMALFGGDSVKAIHALGLHQRLLDNVQLGASYTRSDPFTYPHKFYLNGWENAGRSLRHGIGPNAKEYAARVTRGRQLPSNRPLQNWLPRCYLHWMLRARIRLRRLSAAFTALLTVWCLGCSAYDTLSSGLGLGVVCGARGEMASMSSRDGAPSSDASLDSIEQPAGNQRACGCDSCVAETPSAAVAAVALPPMPATPVFSPASHSRVAPEPLIPPPQHVS